MPNSTKVLITSPLISKMSTSLSLSNQLFLFIFPDFKPPTTICCSPGFFPKNVGPISNKDKSS